VSDWGDFPARRIDAATPLFRIHQRHRHPAWFNTDGLLRFDPPKINPIRDELIAAGRQFRIEVLPVAPLP